MEKTRNSRNIFPITSTSTITSKLSTGDDGKASEPSIVRWVETLYLDQPKVKGIDDWYCEQEDEKQNETRKELTLVAQHVAQFCEKYVEMYRYAIMEMHSLAKNQQCFPYGFVATTLCISKATQIQCDEGDSRLGLRLTIAEYNITELKHKIIVLSRRYSISHSTLGRYTGKVRWVLSV